MDHLSPNIFFGRWSPAQSMEGYHNIYNTAMKYLDELKKDNQIIPVCDVNNEPPFCPNFLFISNGNPLKRGTVWTNYGPKRIYSLYPYQIEKEIYVNRIDPNCKRICIRGKSSSVPYYLHENQPIFYIPHPRPSFSVSFILN